MDGINFHSVRNAPFVLDGILNPLPGEFRRVPVDVATATNPGVVGNSLCPAGVRARFSTDASKLVLKAELKASHSHHFPCSGENGFDLYKVGADGREHRVGTMIYGATRDPETCEGISVTLPSGKMATYVLYFPNYSSVQEVYVGLPEEAKLEAPVNHYIYTDPVVYYGSSITQGGCASRAALSYEAIISRMLRTQFINLGFSGSAKGEDAIVDYMASIPNMSAFVLDYDHNAPTPEHLAKTHGMIYHKIRAKHPELPIIFVTRPDAPVLSDNINRRREVVMRTYLYARSSGDKNVYYVDGITMMMGDTNGETTVDTCHPNDLGFRQMAYAIGGTLDPILRQQYRKKLAKEESTNG